jgi:hypothetical protein
VSSIHHIAWHVHRIQWAKLALVLSQHAERLAATPKHRLSHCWGTTFACLGQCMLTLYHCVALWQAH